jgi:hypothetical protein
MRGLQFELHLIAVVSPGFLRVSARTKLFQQRPVQKLVGLHQTSGTGWAPTNLTTLLVSKCAGKMRMANGTDSSDEYKFVLQLADIATQPVTAPSFSFGAMQVQQTAPAVQQSQTQQVPEAIQQFLRSNPQLTEQS